MRDDDGLTIPGTEGDTWEDDERPIRCLLCMEIMPKDEWSMHDCPIAGWEWADE
jgi:hypothetical protein